MYLWRIAHLIRHPVLGFDRLAQWWQVHVRGVRELVEQQAGESYDRTMERLDSRFNAPLTPVLAEEHLSRLELELELSTQALSRSAQIGCFHNADRSLGRLIYAVCRVLQPRRVIETGVGNGMTSAYILRALGVNGHGTLHSVDLPPFRPGAHASTGRLVGGGDRARWTLHYGASRRVLPGILAEIGTVDLFIHDSLHSYENILLELNLVTPYLSARSMVIADDLTRNPALADWAASQRDWQAFLFRQLGKPFLSGIALRSSGCTGPPRHNREPPCRSTPTRSDSPFLPFSG